MADFGEPPDQGEPFGNGPDHNGRTLAALTRLGERTSILERTVSSLTEDIRHLPTKTTSMWALTLLIAMIALVATAYWNGISGKFEGVGGQFTAVNAKFDAINAKLDNLSRQVDKLQSSPPSAPAASPTPHPHH